jgi:NOL1/NOP2/fmu family ribosome biogenesis protein
MEPINELAARMIDLGQRAENDLNPVAQVDWKLAACANGLRLAKAVKKLNRDILSTALVLNKLAERYVIEGEDELAKSFLSMADALTTATEKL